MDTLLDGSALGMRNHLEVLLGQIVQCLCMSLELPSVCHLEIEDNDVQVAGSGNLRVQLPEGTRSGIPWICKERLAIQLPLLVELVEHLLGHIDLSPHDKPGQGLREPHGDGTDSTQVLRNILAHTSVSTGRSANK